MFHLMTSQFTGNLPHRLVLLNSRTWQEAFTTGLTLPQPRTWQVAFTTGLTLPQPTSSDVDSWVINGQGRSSFVEIGSVASCKLSSHHCNSLLTVLDFAGVIQAAPFFPNRASSLTTPTFCYLFFVDLTTTLHSLLDSPTSTYCCLFPIDLATISPFPTGIHRPLLATASSLLEESKLTSHLLHQPSASPPPSSHRQGVLLHDKDATPTRPLPPRLVPPALLQKWLHLNHYFSSYVRQVFLELHHYRTSSNDKQCQPYPFCILVTTAPVPTSTDHLRLLSSSGTRVIYRPTTAPRRSAGMKLVP
ncbi:hypothetical protein BHE74_00029898 [Ensete ventricosum]|nr:hypothetical protein BHE74_00029898 [Ensete ventricosum]RZS18099.1 hypothetical protein BHM03_00050326 [Ensete ventricosum]